MTRAPIQPDLLAEAMEAAEAAQEAAAEAVEKLAQLTPQTERDEPAKRTLTLRLPLLVHEQLREMSSTSRKSQHALLMEGLNLLFERYGKPPIGRI